MGLIDKALGRDVSIGRISFSPASLKALPENVKGDIIKRAESVDSFPYLSLSLYRDYARTGNRARFEKPYFEKRRNLTELVLAEAIEDKGRFADMIEEGIWSLLSEPAWTIPPHNTYVRDQETLDTPLLERPILDLFQCETGEILAMTISMLSQKLNPVLKMDVEHVLRENIIKPYIEDHFWWMGADGDMNNWSPWCTQNVLITAFSLPLTEKENRKVLFTAIDTLESYINSYPDDGGCDEGASYYHAAALALWGCLYIISKATANPLSSVFADKKIKAMAEYIEKVHIADDIYLNFADCSPKSGHLTGREYLFGKAVGSNALMHHAAQDTIKDWREDDNNYNLFYAYITLSNYGEIAREAEKTGDFAKPAFTAFSSTGLAIYRGSGIVFAIKGGNNGESHNHNDLGSITLYIDNFPCLIDIGVETYTKTTFSPERYTLSPMRSTYHNTLNFPPLEEAAGSGYKAEILSLDDASISLDLVKAFPESKELRKYRRSAAFDREKGVISINEDFDSDNPAVLSLLTLSKPEANDNTLSWPLFTISFPEPVTHKTETMEITDARLRKAWPERIYRTLVTLPGPLTWNIIAKGEYNEN